MFRQPFLKIIFILSLFVSSFAQVKTTGEISLTRCWTSAIDGVLEFTTDAATIFMASADGKIEALSVDGKKLWASELGGEASSNILASESSVFVVTSVISTRESMLRSLSKTTGITNWTLKLPNSDRHYLTEFNGSVVVVSLSGIVEAADTKNGALKWQRNITDKFAASPVISGGKAALASVDNQVFVVSLASGEIDSMRKLPLRITALAAGADGQSYFGDERGNIQSRTNGSEKPSWKFKTGGEISHLMASGKHVLVVSHDNFVYALLARNGHVEWKKRLSGRASNIAIVADKYAIITSIEEQGAMLVKLGSGRVVSQTLLGPGETVTGAPLFANGQIYLPTNRSISAYSINGCIAK